MKTNTEKEKTSETQKKSIEGNKKMNKTSTIGRNRKKIIAQIFEKATSCKLLTLGNYFIGEDCNIEVARDEFFNEDYTKLRSNGAGSFTLHVHSNRWYYITSPVSI